MLVALSVGAIVRGRLVDSKARGGDRVGRPRLSICCVAWPSLPGDDESDGGWRPRAHSGQRVDASGDENGPLPLNELPQQALIHSLS